MTTKALLVGIAKYANPRNNLDGVENDIAAMVKVLGKFGVSDLEIIRDSNATSESIKNALNSLVSDSKDGDVRIFYYSGHGFQLPKDMSGGDDGKQDEALVPYEGTSSSLILDTWISQFLKLMLPAKTSLWVVYDSCHSGNMYKDVLLDTAAEKEVSVTGLRFDSPPLSFSVFPLSKNPSVKDIVLDDSIPNSFHFGAVQPDTTALVQEIDGVRRSVFTWAVEAAAAPGMTVADFEGIVTSKQVAKTPNRIPQIACAPANKDRVLFSGI